MPLHLPSTKAGLKLDLLAASRKQSLRAPPPPPTPPTHPCTERLYPRLLDWIADSAQQAQQEALASLRKLAHQLLVGRDKCWMAWCVAAWLRWAGVQCKRPLSGERGEVPAMPLMRADPSLP